MVDSLRINFVTGAVRRYVPEIEAVATVPARVEAAVSTLPGRAWSDAVDGEWLAARVIGHMIAYAEQNRENLYRMAYMTDPIIKPADDAGQAELNGWESQPRERLLERLELAIASIVQLLKGVPDSSWGRPGQHPDQGRRSIAQHVRAVARHLDEHVAQLEAMRQ